MITTTPVAGVPAQRSKTKRLTAFDISAILLTVVLAIIFFFPLYWAIIGALKRPNELQVIPPLLYPPNPQWLNFVEVGRVIPFYRYVLNTAIITILSTIGGVLSASLVGYGFSSFRFRGRHVLFIILLATMVLPSEVTLIPTFVLFVNYLGWGNSINPLVIPSWFGGGAFSIFLFRQFFASIPKDLNDAAKIDGCGPFRYYATILMPLSVPVIITLSILWFQFSWNDLIGPLIYLTDPEKYTVSTGLLALRTSLSGTFSRRGQSMDHLLMAGSLIGMLPSLVIFFALQRYFIKGVIMTGIKG
ncbi:MAG: carbohydrate ABC transporter permease [Chloroflexi bacterium]|nr:carbohydrate ABC transporter permease [Chloroflexota bacterium]